MDVISSNMKFMTQYEAVRSVLATSYLRTFVHTNPHTHTHTNTHSNTNSHTNMHNHTHACISTHMQIHKIYTFVYFVNL